MTRFCHSNRIRCLVRPPEQRNPSIPKDTLHHWTAWLYNPKLRLVTSKGLECSLTLSSSRIRSTPRAGSPQHVWRNTLVGWLPPLPKERRCMARGGLAAREWYIQMFDTGLCLLADQTPDGAKVIQHVGQSVKVWPAAADLEHDIKARKRVLRMCNHLILCPFSTYSPPFPTAVEHILNPVRLWKETANLETNPADARIILSRAVEVIPLSVELWQVLTRLEIPERAKAVLNEARKAIPTSHDIWIAASRLLEQETYSNPDTTPEQRER